MRRLLVGCLVGLVLSLAAAESLAQQGTAEIAGKVTDEQGAVLPGVAIVVTNEETGVFRDVVTGPATDNRVGARFVESLGLSACNARTNPKQLGDLVLEKIRPHLGKPHEN